MDVPTIERRVPNHGQKEILYTSRDKFMRYGRGCTKIDKKK